MAESSLKEKAKCAAWFEWTKSVTAQKVVENDGGHVELQHSATIKFQALRFSATICYGLASNLTTFYQNLLSNTNLLPIFIKIGSETQKLLKFEILRLKVITL